MKIGGYDCRRLWRTLECQRKRHKSYFQIVLELLAKAIGKPYWTTKLMEISLTHQGIGSRIRAEELFGDTTPAADFASPGAIIRGRCFLDFTDENIWIRYRAHYGSKIQGILSDAERICRHEFNLLGSGVRMFGSHIDWHVDPVSGYRWPKELFSELKGAARSPKGTDIKLPWDLSRMQHLPTLGKAYRLMKDERYASEIVDQISHWLDDNPCGYGVNWTCAMDVAIRIMNIVWGYLLIKDARVVTGEFRSRLGISIFQHGQHILFNLEYGLRNDGSITNGNHFLGDIVGLLHLGVLCPELKAADRWKTLGIKALVEEIERQVHSDGVDFESSVAYHRLVLELFTAGALLCRANGIALPDRFWQRLEKMYDFVLFVTRPDGRVPLVGDADDGRLYVLSDYGNWDRTDFRYLLSMGAVLFNRPDMKAQAGEFSEDAFWLLGPGAMEAFVSLKPDEYEPQTKGFPEAGLYVMRQADSYLLACCGNVGTKGLGNHKHNDILSFELYAGDKAFIVDPGTFVYTRNSDWRNLFRSTGYHNTVVVDGQEQNRFDPKRVFEMTPDAEVIVHEWISTPNADRLDVEHTGYLRLDPPVRHRRKFVFDKTDGTWEIVDVIKGAGEHTADWYFHFDANIDLVHIHRQRFHTCCKGKNLEIEVRSEIPLVFEILDGWVSRCYGQKLPSKILHIRGKFNSACRTVLTIQTE